MMAGEYYKTKESVKEYIELAKDVNGKQLIEKLISYLPLQSRLLEIGSGPGSDWEILNQSYEVTGSDNSTEFIDHLIKKYPSGNFMELDAITLKTDQKFDGVYSNKVMHHLKDDEFLASLKRQSEILDANGIICHSFWKGEGSEVFKGLFVNYHNQDSLTKAFNKYFEILLIEDYQEFDENDSILLIARKK